MPSLKYNQVTSAIQGVSYLNSLPLGVTNTDSIIYHDGEMYILMLGASIFNSVVDTGPHRVTLETQLSAAGYKSRVFDRATGGDRARTLLTHIRDEDMLTPFLPVAEKCLCMIHIGGNDVSSDGPYPGYATELESDIREILQWLKDRNFNFALSPISYRIPPNSNPTAPYNEAIYHPIIQEFSPEWIIGGVPKFNMYDYFINNQSILQGDGVHLTNPVGEDQVREDLIGKTIIDNIVQRHTPDTTYVEDVIVNFGGRPSQIIGDYCNINAGALTSDKLVNTNFTGIVEGNTITASEGAENFSGRVTTEDLTPTITNNSLVRRGIFGDTITLDMTDMGLDPAANYTVKLISSRDSGTGTRVSEVTVNGIMQVIDAEANPPTILEWTGVNGTTLASSGLVSTKQAGSTHTYMNGLQITKE